MTVSSRSILACALVLVQLAAAHGHAWHHALVDHVSDERPAPGEAACTHTGGGCCGHSSPPTTHGQTPHDCHDCAVCEKSEPQLMRTTSTQRLVKVALTASAQVPDVAQPPMTPISPGPMADSPLPSPERLNAVTLPLLD